MQNITCVLLIDKRLANYDEIIASANAVTACVVFDYAIDTFDTLRTLGIDRITPENRVVRTWVYTTEPQQQQQQLREYRNIGLMQHNTNGAQYFATANESGCQLYNVAEADPSLETWANYIEFINTCVRDYGLQTYDMMACALYSDANWKYAIDEMTVRCGITIRASLDNTGAADLKGDWFLLVSNRANANTVETVDLTTIYFTDEILKYDFVLTSGIQANVFVLDVSGIPYCWGNNGWGQLAYSTDGGSTLPQVTTPIRYGTITDAVASAQTTGISAILTSSGAVYTTGNSANKELGPGRPTTNVRYIPGPITSNGVVMQVACGLSFTMVLFTTGKIGGWGDNTYSQITADGISNNGSVDYVSPNMGSIIGDGGNSNFISVACGQYHTIAVKYMQTAFTWGANYYGQCGRDNITSPIAVGGVTAGSNTILKIAAWQNSTAILRNTSTGVDIFACGYNGSNEITPDAVTYYSTWVNVTTSSGIAFTGSFYPVSMTGGDASMQILMNDGTIYSKGYNATGVAGNNTISNTTSGLFVKANVITSAVAICNGQYSMTAIIADGSVYTWGANSSYQLGDGTITQQTIPSKVTTLTTLGITAMTIGNTTGGFYSGIITSVAARAALAKIINLNTASLTYRYVGSKTSFTNAQLHNAVDNRRSILIVVKATTGAIALGYFGPTLQASEYFQSALIGQAWVCPFMAPDTGGNTISTVKYYNTKRPDLSALNQSAYGIRIGSSDLIIGSQATSTGPEAFDTPPNGLLGTGTGNLEFIMAEFEVFYAPQLVLVVTAADYESTFTSHTFTPAGATGINGPTLSAVRTAYITAAWAQDTTNNWLNMTSNDGIQLWTVPKTGKYTIKANGAKGGNADTATGGLGASITISTSLVKNDIIKILCGQMGGTASINGRTYIHPVNAGGGGGGTYIYNVTTASIILIAGGGGGAAKGDLNSGFIPARYILNGSNAGAYNETSGTNGTVGGGNLYGYSGGNGGSGGNAGLASTGGGSSGAGWNGSGVKGMFGGAGGLSFSSGGTGGENVTYAGSFVSNTNGGFGGGSGAGLHNDLLAVAGGGAGFSGGGGGGQCIGGGGGGGNYMITGSTYISSSTNADNGSVTITLLLTSPATLTFLKIAYYTKFILNSTITLPATDIITNNTDTVKTVTHTSGSTGVATITTAANVGTVTVKGLGTTTITSTIAATANFDAITVTSITITVIGSGSTLTGATMTSVDLTSTDLTGSVFSGCDLTSANLYGATFNAATDLRGSTLTSLKSGRINGFTTLLPTGYKMI